VEAHITAEIAISEGTRQRNVSCVAGITRKTTKAASIIAILSKETIHTEPPRKLDTNTHFRIYPYHNSSQPSTTTTSTTTTTATTTTQLR
jgi:hypothetical protein